MEQAQLNWITGYIWGIADDVLRDLYVRGKYRDVILPMTVLRRLDAVLEDTSQDVLDMKRTLDDAGVVEQDQALRQAAGQAFYNTSKFTMRDLKARASQQQLRADFEAYLDGFSPNVQDILENFEFRNQIPRLSKADALGTLIEKLTSPDINLSPEPVLNNDGSVRLPGLDNHAMGTIFEELVRRFNEENNEEAGEHWTPRDAVKLMAKLIFLPIADEIESGTYLLYDGACGTGGMLTVAEETLQQLAEEHGKEVATHLFGQEINAETYAICKADLLLKGEGDAADNIVGGPEHSTLSNDAFPSREFDFMLSNPPYGKSWKSDLERMGGKKDMRDARFVIEHAGDPEYSLVTRSNDGQMLFLANMLSKMKQGTKLGSRIAEVHNGSSLFTGDAGQGESNIRRWIIENDWLEAIVALPLNMFYNTDIATYIWVISNRKAAHRVGRVQLIDATQWFKPLRKNLGKKSCELSEKDIQRICDTFLSFEETEESKIFPNQAFGYWKVTVERPLRIEGADPNRAHKAAEIRALKANGVPSEDAPPVIKKVHSQGTAPDPLRGLFYVTIGGRSRVVEYAPDTDLRDTEQVSMLEEGGIEAFLRRDVLPYAADAWYVPDSVKTGYEISFTRHFYKPEPMRSLEEIRADILALEQEKAVIHQAVTRGLDPDVPLKDSGVEWLRRVPEHWSILPSKALFRQRKEKARPDDQQLTASQAHGIISQAEFMAREDRRVMPVLIGESILKHVEPDDFVISMRSFQGGIEWSRVRGAISSAYVMLIPTDAVHPAYFSYLLKSREYIAALRRTSDLVRDGQALRFANFAQVPLPLIPLSEQRAIAEFLDSSIERLGTAIDRAQREIALLDEYRTRLITDVVTGKLDVRDAAASLPEVGPSDEGEDHTDALDSNTPTNADDLDQS